MDKGVIRFARDSDLAQIVELQKAIIEELKMDSYDEESLVNYVTFCIESPTVISIVAELHGRVVGCIGAIIYPDPKNQYRLTANEIGWYLYPEYRKTAGKQLFESLEKTLKGKNIDLIVGAPETKSKLGIFFERMGYEKYETKYKKRM